MQIPRWYTWWTYFAHVFVVKLSCNMSSGPRPLYPRERDPARIVQEAGWDSGPVSTGTKITPPLGFDLWTVQPVASRYT